MITFLYHLGKYIIIKRFVETDSKSKETINPKDFGKIGKPSNREYLINEELVPIVRLSSDSMFVKYNGDEIIEKYDAKNVLTNESFWCSSGNHGLKDEIKFQMEFEKPFRMNSMWIHWAFAPGRFSVKFSNDNQNFYDLFEGFRNSIKDGDSKWWKSLLSNPKTRWNYRSFDEKIYFSEAIWGKYIEITMKIPVNFYFGINKIEFYSKSKSIVMIKSLKPSENLCISIGNGSNANYSPVIASECLQVLSNGDNRDIWVLNSNGFITSLRNSKCLESPNVNRVDIVECGLASFYRDDREKWIIDYDGKIRSAKHQYTCLSLTDESFGDFIPKEDIKSSASSTQSDNLHDSSKALDDDVNTFWASNPSKNNVIFELFFHKYPYVIKYLEIIWKFPAKHFTVLGLLNDGFWRYYDHITNNRESYSNILLKNNDIMGIKIIMNESTTKFEEFNIFGIKSIKFHTGSTYLKREPCKKILNQANLWKIIDVSYSDEETGLKHYKAWSELLKSRTKFKKLYLF